MAKRPFRNTFASLALGLFSIVFVFPISESEAVTSCKGSASDAAILALRGLTVSCFGLKFEIQKFQFDREKRVYVFKGDIGAAKAGRIQGPNFQQLKFVVQVGEKGRTSVVRFADERDLTVRAKDSNVRLFTEQLVKKVQADIKVRFRECEREQRKLKVRDHRIPKPECLLEFG
jgi:hypothetical protein